MRYVIIVYIAGYVVNLINPDFYYSWLMLDIDMLAKGQVWRLFTFLIQPMESSILFMALMLYVYFSIGMTLEKVWGTFRFNLFYFMGIISNILAVLLIYLISFLAFGKGMSYPVSLSFLNMSMLLAFAVTFPELQFYLMFLIPIKAKWLSIGYALLFAYKVITAFVDGIFIGFSHGEVVFVTNNVFSGFATLLIVLVAMANFLVYYLMLRKVMLSPSHIKRRMEFKRSFRQGEAMGYTRTVTPNDDHKGNTVKITRHKCAVCGRTELDGDNLQFRFCSKCNGNYEYCQDHLFTHEHIK